MKILLVSDTHGREGALKEVLETERPDFMCHMGDVEGSEDYIRALAQCPVAMVAGNNDFFSDLNSEVFLELEGFRLMLTHGHYFYISLGTERLKEEGRAHGADIVLFGHTHRPYLEDGDGIILANPGSLVYPRQEKRRPSYMILTLEKGRTPIFVTKFL